MKTSQIQKQLDQLFSMTGLEGEITITIRVDAASYREVNEKQESDLSQLICPAGASNDHHCFYSKMLTVYIMHVKA